MTLIEFYNIRTSDNKALGPAFHETDVEIAQLYADLFTENN